ncbi:MAG: hypothetical protein A07HR67_00839 [uncultured archaeon A07HR67]|nr:MAG: hypothetical protein A07HR67_00839 [uncultured archaeon A07HR67]
MSHDHDEHGGHEPRPTGSPKRDAERAATIGGFAGAVLGARGGPIGAGIGGVLGGSTGYILGYAASGLDQPSDDSPETTLDRDHTGDAGHELDDVSHEPDDVGHEPDDDGPVTIEMDP